MIELLHGFTSDKVAANLSTQYIDASKDFQTHRFNELEFSVSEDDSKFEPGFPDLEPQILTLDHCNLPSECLYIYFYNLIVIYNKNNIQYSVPIYTKLVLKFFHYCKSSIFYNA